MNKGVERIMKANILHSSCVAISKHFKFDALREEERGCLYVDVLSIIVSCLACYKISSNFLNSLITIRYTFLL